MCIEHGSVKGSHGFPCLRVSFVTGYLESLLGDIGSVHYWHASEGSGCLFRAEKGPAGNARSTYGVSLRAGDHEMGYPIP